MEDGCVFYRDSLRLPPLLRDTQHAHRERMDVRLSYDLTWLHRRPSISLPPVDSYATEAGSAGRSSLKTVPRWSQAPLKEPVPVRPHLGWSH